MLSGYVGPQCTSRTTTPLISWLAVYVSYFSACLPFAVLTVLVACITFFIAKAKFLPRMQLDKLFRWDYDYTEIGESNDGYAYSLTDLEDFPSASLDSDEWTIGSSSSFSSGHRSPSTGARTPTEDPPNLWEGETLASSSDTEAQR